jgi:hypothetical protein
MMPMDETQISHQIQHRLIHQFNYHTHGEMDINSCDGIQMQSDEKEYDDIIVIIQ